MKSFTAILNAGFAGLMFSSLIFAPVFLNGNLFIKEVAVEVIIGLFSIPLILFLLFSSQQIRFRVTLIDFLIAGLLIIYSYYFVLFYHDSSVHLNPFYYGLYYFILKLVLDNNEGKVGLENFEQIIIIVPLVLLAHSTLVIFQRIGFFPALHTHFSNGSTFGNPDMLGAYLAVLMPFCLIIKGRWKALGQIAFFSGLFVLFTIEARTAILALLISGSLWLFLNRRISLKWVILLMLVFLVVLGLLILWHPESVYGRLFIWFVSLKMILVKPFGWGLYAFEKNYPEFQASFLSNNQNIPKIISPELVHSPFNEFLHIGVVMGIPGMLIFAILVVLLFFLAIKSRSVLIYPLLIFFVVSLSYFPFFIAPLVALIIPMLVSVSLKSNLLFKLSLTGKLSKIPGVGLLGLSILMITLSISSFIDLKKWQKAVIFSGSENTLSDSENTFREIYPRMKRNGRFLISYSNLKYKQGDNRNALKFLEEAEHLFCDISISIRLARFYQKSGNYAAAEKMLDQAINIAPKSFEAYYEKILFLRNIGDLQRAYLETLKFIKRPQSKSLYPDEEILKSRLKSWIYDYEQKELHQNKFAIVP